MKPKNEKEIAAAPLPLNPLALSAEDQKEMYGEMDQEDIVVPRLVVLQALSPEVADGLGRPGNFFIVGLNQELGKEVEFIPILRNRSRIRWKPMTEGGGILCRSFDGKVGFGDPGGSCVICPKKEWMGNTPPSCDQVENVVVILRHSVDLIPLALSGSKTRLKAMKQLNTLFLAQQQQGLQLYRKSYVAKVVEKANKGGLKYFSFQVVPGNENGFLPEAESARGANVYQTIKGKKLVVNAEKEAGDLENPEL